MGVRAGVWLTTVGGYAWWWWWAVAWCVWGCGQGAVIPPRWVNATLNPCAHKSWQLLYWPHDHTCHRIFTQGPCGETQEFYYDPARGMAACRCPRGTLLYPPTGRCYPSFSRGPCAPREYLGTDAKELEGKCRGFLECPPRHVFWPRTKRCYEYHTRGPCLKGYLIYISPDTGFPDCGCDRTLMFSTYWSLTGLCFELFRRGPCLEGTIFLYNATKGATECSCSPSIVTNYHGGSDGCYELNRKGPCHPGQILAFDPNAMATRCECRDDHALWPSNGHCYLLYSRGPCDKGHFFAPVAGDAKGAGGECRPYPCAGTRRYDPATDACFRLGWRGPCPEGQLFVYDEESPLRGACGCTPELVGYWATDGRCYELGGRGPCRRSQVLSYDKATGSVFCTCDVRKGFVGWRDGGCYRLETRGPCRLGQLLAVKQWRPVTPFCTSAASPNSPLILAEIPPRSNTPQNPEGVTASRGNSIYSSGNLNDSLAIDSSNASSSRNAEEDRLRLGAEGTHRTGRQLAEGPSLVDVYSLGSADGSYSLGSQGSTGDTETWGFLDETYIRILGESSSTYYTGRNDGERSETPWWGSVTTIT